MKSVKKTKRSTVFAYLVVGSVLTLFYLSFGIYLWMFDYKKKDNTDEVSVKPSNNNLHKRDSYTPPAGVWPLVSGRLSQSVIYLGDELTVSVMIKNTADQTGVLPIVVSQRPEKLFRFTVSVLENGKPTQSLPQIKDSSLINGYDSTTDSVLLIAPQSSYSVDVRLDKLFQLSAPGEYRIDVEYDPTAVVTSAAMPDVQVWDRPTKPVTVGTLKTIFDQFNLSKTELIQWLKTIK